MLSYVRGHVAEPRKAPLCGNSIATDRSFIARDMPALDAYLHYRMVDVSSVKELARRWYPRAYFASPPKHGGHRALADIRESIQELRYYRETMFVPQPGPDSVTARQIAARYAIGTGPDDQHPPPRRRPNPVRPSDRGPLCFIQPGSDAAGTMVGVAQLVRAPGCGPGGRGFESPRPPQRTAGQEARPG